MAKQKWDVNINGDLHRVEVRYSRWSLAGEILVDDQVIEAWGATRNLAQRRFTVAGKEAIVRWPGVITSKSELFIDGSKVR